MTRVQAKLFPPERGLIPMILEAGSARGEVSGAPGSIATGEHVPGLAEFGTFMRRGHRKKMRQNLQRGAVARPPCRAAWLPHELFRTIILMAAPAPHRHIAARMLTPGSLQFAREWTPRQTRASRCVPNHAAAVPIV